MSESEELRAENRKYIDRLLELFAVNAELVEGFDSYLVHRWALCSDQLAGRVMVSTAAIFSSLVAFLKDHREGLVTHQTLLENYFEFWVQYASLYEDLQKSKAQLSANHRPLFMNLVSIGRE